MAASLSRDTEIIASLRNQLDEANETIRQLTESIAGPSSVRYRGLKVGRSERAILDAFLAANGYVGRRALSRVVGVAIGRIVEVDSKTVDVAICRLRKKLRALDPPIQVATEWGEGYYMTELHKSRLVAMRYLLEVP